MKTLFTMKESTFRRWRTILRNTPLHEAGGPVRGSASIIGAGIPPFEGQDDAHSNPQYLIWSASWSICSYPCRSPLSPRVTALADRWPGRIASVEARPGAAASRRPVVSHSMALWKSPASMEARAA